MKKIIKNAWMLAAAAGTLFFTACDPEETTIDAPSITISTDPANGTVAVGEAFSFSVVVNAPAGFNTVRITGVSVAGGTITLPGNYQSEYTRNDLGLTAQDTEATATFQTIEFEDAGEYTFELLAVDEAGQQTEADFTVTVTEAGINVYEDVLFGAQGNANPGFYNALDGQRYTYAQARDASGTNSSTVDFAYYFGNNNRNTIASIDSEALNDVYVATNPNLSIENNFGTRNSTRFRVTGLSPNEFDAISNNSALFAAADSELNTSVSATQLSVGSVVAFQLDASRGGYVGLIHVTDINDTNGNGTITIEVKVQEAN